MTRNIFLLFCLIAISIAFCSSSAFAQSNGSAGWADYLADEYDIAPNITYSTAGNVDVKLDLYTPRNRVRAVPVVIYIHGGGWVEGRKEYDTLHILPYMALGWAVANVEYRLARNALAPASVEDCAARCGGWCCMQANTTLIPTGSCSQDFRRAAI